MPRLKTLIVIAGLAAITAMPALALEQYGSIIGRVVDNDGVALPGVTVVVSGAVLQGTRTVITGADGSFRVSPLPPGDGYTVVMTLQNFDRLEHTGLPVRLGNDTEIAATMNMASFQEVIEVTADRIVVDTSKSAVDTAVSYDLIDALVNPRNFQGVTDMVPGVQRGANNPRMHGAASSDNLYLVDGVDSTDPRTQTWGTAFNFDSVAEVQVQTAGYAAEYGRATGGIVNLVTKSGGNEFHGVARYIVSKADWADSLKEGRASTGLQDEERPALTVGGPILRDRLWFLVAYEERDRISTFPRYTDSTVSNLITEESTYVGHYAQGKLTWQVTPSNSVVGFYNEDPVDFDWALGWGYGFDADPESEIIQEQGGERYSAQLTSIVSEDAFIEAMYNQYNGNINWVPQSGMLGPGPTYLELTTYWWSGTPLDYYDSERTRTQLSGALTYFLGGAGASSHQLKAGLDWMENKNTVLDSYYPNGGPLGDGQLVITWEGEPWIMDVYRDRDGFLESKNPYLALYVQDSWKAGNLTLNMGVRAEQLDMKNDAGASVTKFGLGEQIAPRLGFAYDLKGDSLHGSLSRFYDIASDYITASMQPSTERVEEYLWDNGEWVLIDEWFLKAGNSVDPNLDPTYTDELSLGYDKRLSSTMSVGVNYVWRRQKDAIEDFDSGTNGDLEADDGSSHTANWDGTWLKYQAVELVLRKAFADDGFQFITSYTFNFENEGYAAWSGTTFASQRSGFGDCSICMENWYGDLDTKHLFKLDGSYSHELGPVGLTYGISGAYYSGPVWTPIQWVSLAGRYPQFLERAGSREVGSQTDFDLHVEARYNFTANIAAGFYVDIRDLLDNQDPTNINNNVNSGSYGEANAWQTQRRYQVGFKLEF